MNALVTGGGGFLGGRIVDMLRQRGDAVTVLGRSVYPHLAAKGVRCIQADVRDAQAVRAACDGMDVVFHAAAIPGVWGKRSFFWGINVDGTRNVIDGCRQAGVPKLVYSSSPSVVFGPGAICGVDESEPYSTRFLAIYPETKAAAERLVLEANGDQLATVAIRPHLIWGPGDPHLIPRIVARAKAGQLRQVGDGKNLVDVTYIDNAAEAHLLAFDALHSGAACAGRAYFISQGAPVTFWPWINEILVAIGVPTAERRVSYRVAYCLGGLLELIHGLFRSAREPRMTRFVAHQLALSHYFNIDAAKRDIGYHPRVSTEEGVRRLIESLRVESPTADGD